MSRSGIDSRRPGARQNHGRILRRPAATSGPGTPLTIFGGPSVVLQWVRGDLGVTGATNASAWADQSGNVAGFTSATGPAINASDGTLAGLQTLTGDGIAHIMTSALNRPAPGPGTETTIILVMKQEGWLGGACFCGGGNAQLTVRQGGVTPQINQNNGLVVNTSGGAGLGVWVRIWASFTGVGNDMLKVGASAVAGPANAGANDPGPMSIFARSSSQFSNVTMFEFLTIAGVPSASSMNAYDSYLSTLTGGIPLI